MARLTTIIAAAGLLVGAAVLAVPAAAAPYCPTSESFFGMILRSSGNDLTVRTNSGHYATVAVENSAHINANGNSMRAGTYVGAYGCVTPNGIFHANEITLSSNPSTYSQTLTGIVQRVENGRLIVREKGAGFGTWFVPDSEDFHAGQTVTASGFDSSNGTFYPQTINGQSIAFDTDNASANAPEGSVTLSGTIQRVGTHTIAVWETSRRETGEWVVADAGQYRVGEMVTGTGTEDRHGHFYPQTVSVTGTGRPPSVASITLTGTVQRVGTHTLAVWEPSRHETGTWIVANAGQYRIGQQVTGTGTEDRAGHFYPNSVSIP